MRGRHVLVVATVGIVLVLAVTTSAWGKRPDLQVTALSNPPGAVAAGRTFSITDTTSNTGTAGSGRSSLTRYRLSTDTTASATDVLLTGTHAVPVLAAGAGSTATVTVTVPPSVAAGTYHLAACADDAKRITESSEANNCRVASAVLRITKPDLVVSALDDPPASAFTGHSMSFTDTVANTGDAPAPASITRYRLSPDATITRADRLLTGSRSVPALPAGGASARTVTVTIPDATAEGMYYLGACADAGSDVAEADEGNNCRASATRVQVKRPADLVLKAVGNPPAALAAGSSFAVTDTTSNSGRGAAVASVTAYRLSLNTTVNGSDPLLAGSRSIPALAAGVASSGTVTVTVPVSTAPGKYYLGACADHGAVVVESSETNNCRRSATTVLVAARPAISEIAPTSGTAGTLVTISGAGFGATPGGSRVTFNGVPATPATWSATRIVTPVPAGATTGPVVVSMAGADSNAISFTVLADLRVTALSSPPPAAVAGGSFSVTETTTSAGAPVRATVTRYRLSTDGTITPVDALLTGTRAIARLAAGAVSSGTLVVTIPGATLPGTYFLGACADDTGLVVEADETNNCGTSATTVTVRAPPVIASLSVTSGTVGTAVTVTGSGFGAGQDDGRLSFSGTPASVSGWSDTTIVAAVPSGATTGPVTVTVGGVQSNDLAFAVVGSPDLQVISLSAPPAVLHPGGTFVVGETTANLGSAPASATTTRYRLSTDATIDAGDVVLGESRAVGVLAPGLASSEGVTLTIPSGLAPGRYHLAACADAAAVVVESNEANNCRLAGTTAQLTSARDRGIAWLMTHQAGDGSWNSRSGAEVVTAAAALEALRQAGVRGYAYGRAVSWLANAGSHGVDALARQLAVLAAAETTVTPYVERLLSWRNSQGAWGAYAHFETSFPDTALALGAIRASRPAFSDGELTSALCGILPAQRADGGWSHVSVAADPPGPLAGSAVVPSAYNVLELDAAARAKGWTQLVCGSTPYLFSTAIDRGISWLLTQRRNADGGFGDAGASTVLDTAIVHQMLAAVRPADPAAAGAVDYLLARQAADGGWNADALQTAMALLALPAAPAGDTDRDGVPDTIEVLLGTGLAADDSRWLAQTANSPGSVADATAAASLTVVSVVPSSIPADGVARARVTVRLARDGGGVAGQPINVRTSAGTLVGGATGTTIVTGSDGQASVELVAVASKGPIVATVTASYLAAVSASATVDFTGLSVPEVGYLSGTAGNGQVALDWGPPPTGARIVVVRKAGSPPAGAPVDGVNHGVGSDAGGGTVVFNGVASGFRDDGVINGVDYFYRVFVQYGASFLHSTGTPLDLRPSAGAPGQPVWIHALSGGAMAAEPLVGTGDEVHQAAGASRVVAVSADAGAELAPPATTVPALLGGIARGHLEATGTRYLLTTDRSGRLRATGALAGGALWGPTAIPGADAIEAPAAVQAWDASDADFRARYGPTPTDVAFVASRNTSTTTNQVTAVRASDGTVLWQFNEAGARPMDGSVAAPVVDHARNRLYIVTRAGAAGAQASLWVLDTLTGDLAGSLALGHVETRPLLALDGTTLYLATTTGHLEAIDVTTATPVQKWTGPIALGASLAGPIREDVAGGGLLYLATQDGFVWALQDFGGGGPPPAAPVWKTAVAGPSAPLALDASVLVGTGDGTLLELRLVDGVPVGEVTVGDGAHRVGAPASGEAGAIYVGTAGEHLYRYQVPLP